MLMNAAVFILAAAFVLYVAVLSAALSESEGSCWRTRAAGFALGTAFGLSVLAIIFL